MTKTVSIKNLKSISELSFSMPPPGVYLLAGSNGSGKTTLLACLLRLGKANAFALHFPASRYWNFVDDFSAAEISYTVNGRSVTYSYGGERWVPRPRASSDVVYEFGYPDVRYAGATAERITPRNEEIERIRTNAAPSSIIAAANAIFETERFSHLRTVNLTRGNRNQAFLLAPPGAKRKYVTERNFSLGELCVLKLLRSLEQCRIGSLVLIDELELALHPRAQMGLLRHLESMAKEKALTVIVSTHSVTLIKYASRGQLLFLEQHDGRVAVIGGCFPAYAIGSIASTEERAPDVAIYVEDEAAAAVTDALVKLTSSAKFAESSGIFPTVQVTPIGDFKSVVRYYDRNRSLLPGHVRQWIMLDKDVETESRAIMAHNSNDPMRDKFHAHSARIKYLPWTPEVGLMEFLKTNRTEAELDLRTKLKNATLHIAPADLVLPELSGAELRRSAKTAVWKLIQTLHEQASQLASGSLEVVLYELFAHFYFQANREEVMERFAPLLA